MSRRLIVVSVVTVTLASSGLAAAGDGHLDPSFSGNGKVTTPFAGGAYARDVAIQDDGKIVVAGAAAGDLGTGAFALARYESDGSLDATFGVGGRVTTVVGGAGGDEAEAVAIQADGKIVAAGTAGGQRFAVVRYETDGTPDPSFGTDGIVKTNLSAGLDLGYDLLIQPNGKIVVAGSAGTRRPEFALARYLVDGTLDPAFGGDGKVRTRYGIWGVARAIALQPNGKIVAVGTNGSGFALARYRPNGRLDRSFGRRGKVGDSFPGGWANAVAIQPDGRIVAAGDSDIFSFAIARYTAHGRLDRTFSRDGRVTTRVGSGEQMVVGLIVSSNRKIVAVGHVGPHEFGDALVWRFALTRYRRGGGLDPSFGGDGRVLTSFKGGAFAAGATAQPNGRVVVVGGYGEGNAEGFALARYAV